MSDNTPQSYDPSKDEEETLEVVSEPIEIEEEEIDLEEEEDDEVKPSREDKKAAALAKREQAKKAKLEAKAAKAKAKTKKGKSKKSSKKSSKPFPTKIVAISAGAVAVVAAGALVAPMIFNAIGNAGWDVNGPLPKNVADMGSPLVLGNKNASTTLTVWTDLHGVYGKEEQVYGGGFIQLATDKGKIRTEYYMTAYLDQDGSEGSLRGANAALCASDQGKFFEFMNYAFDRQPIGFPDPTDSTGQSYIVPDGYTEKQLLAWSGDIGIPNKAQYDNCVKSIQYRNYVDSVTKAYTENKYTQIPTLLLNGTELTSEQYRLDIFADILGIGWTEVAESTDKSSSTPAPSSAPEETSTPEATPTTTE